MSSTAYLRSLVITTPKDRKNSLRKELAKLPAWVETDILSFATPCVSYRGDTDSSACAQENLFLNHQKCAARLLSEDCNFGLILESDVVFNQRKVAAWLQQAVMWARHNQKQFDMLFIGCYPKKILKNEIRNTKFVTACQASHAHAVIYSEQFCRTLVEMKYPGGHFDVYLRSKGTVRQYMMRTNIALQNDLKHRMESRYGYLQTKWRSYLSL